MTMTPQQVAQKWARNLNAAGESIRAGVEAVTVSPTEKAARRVDAYAAGVQRAVADGTFVSGLRRVTLEAWKDSMLKKGAPRIGAGATAAVGKMEGFLAEFLPYVDSGKRALEATPRGDLQTNIQRMIAMVEHNARFRRR